MQLSIDLDQFRYDGSKQLKIAECPNEIKPLYEDNKDYKKQLKNYRKEIDELQLKMYAHDRYGMLLIFQAMDAAGKDGTIRHVMSGINPHGVEVNSFKKPSHNELDRTFLWRTNVHMPARGKVHIFNRSYYEEVLVTKVHPKIITDFQRLPESATGNMEQLWQQRYQSINDLERHEANNGIVILKFFLNLSKDEQRRRFIERIDKPEKNWKFSEADINERQHWQKYMQAYEDAINHTANSHAPWYVIPADDKKNMRLMVSAIILQTLSQLDMHFPNIDEKRRQSLQGYKKMLLDEKN